MNSGTFCTRSPFRLRFSLVASLLAASLFAAVLSLSIGCDSSDQTNPAREGSQQPGDAGPSITDRSEAAEQSSVSPEIPAKEVPVPPGAIDRGAELSHAEQLTAKQDFGAAAAILRKLLLSDPNDVETKFRLANLEAVQGDFDAGIGLLGEIPEDHPEAGLPALGQSAEWCLLAERFDEAEKKYTRLLQLAPQAAQARRQLAYLLNRQGRRQEAASHLYELCKLGNVRLDELQALICISAAIYDDPNVTTQSSQGKVLYHPIGPGGEARFLLSERRYNDAVAALHPAVVKGKVSQAILALYGRAVAESQNDERFTWWLTQTDEQTRQFADYWAALGIYELSKRRYDRATRALAEAIDRDPTDYISMARLRQCLQTLGDTEASQRWQYRWRTTRESVLANIRISQSQSLDPDALAELATLLTHLDRRLEATLWRSMEAYQRNASETEFRNLNSMLKQLVSSGNGSPTREERLCSLKLSDYPLPALQPNVLDAATVSSTQTDGNAVAPASFDNISTRVGLNHTYQVASRPQQLQYAIYQTLGGGVAALDYELDGSTDLYFAQGGSDPPDFVGGQSNQCFRQVDDQLIDVTQVSRTSENQYCIGVTAGDWNQDGFADVLVANIGTNVLLTNNGDGTFSRRQLSDKRNNTIVPASAAIADITGDALPDIIQTIYVNDADLGRKPPMDDSGRVQSRVSPGDFTPGNDYYLVNDGRGEFAVELFDENRTGVYPGLGVVVADFNDDPGNEVFVGNDLFPNQFWIRDPATGRWSDAAPVLGCAYGFSGLGTGSMGISTGDYDRNGSIDIHVTNYEAENASLFISRDGAFQDRNVQFQLAGPSHTMVGFGTQSIDYENDGDVEFIVTNGHLDDSIENVAPFRQPAQLFCNVGGRFEMAEVDDPSGYWHASHLGRGLARLDFDRDGKSDVVITHINEPSAILLNRTKTNHHWIQLRLVGTQSERDAIGARVRIRYSGQEATDWLVAGDGYLSQNESTICFGLGPATKIDHLSIRWPSGIEQSFNDVDADRRYLVVEQAPGVPAPPALFDLSNPAN